MDNLINFAKQALEGGQQGGQQGGQGDQSYYNGTAKI
jgi:hypothetical protein